jgi:hypothetical protein
MTPPRRQGVEPSRQVTDCEIMYIHNKTVEERNHLKKENQKLTEELANERKERIEEYKNRERRDEEQERRNENIIKIFQYMFYVFLVFIFLLFVINSIAPILMILSIDKNNLLYNFFYAIYDLFSIYILKPCYNLIERD